VNTQYASIRKNQNRPQYIPIFAGWFLAGIFHVKAIDFTWHTMDSKKGRRLP
jgi:hypothetical protein